MRSFLVKGRKWPSLKRENSLENTRQKLTSKPSTETADLGKDVGKPFASHSEDIKPLSPLESLPFEIFERVLYYLFADRRNPKDLFITLFALSQVSRAIQEALPNSTLYDTVVLFNKKQALRFYKTISKSKNRHNAEYVHTVCFVQPKLDTGAGIELDNTGYSFTGSSSNTNEKSWPDLILDIISSLPHVTDVIFDEAGPRFTFPSSVESSRAYQQLNNRQHPISVYFAPESGWHRNLKPNTLWPLGRIGRLHLSSIIIDDQSLAKGTERANPPLKGCCSSVKELQLSGCWIRADPNLMIKYFSNVESLILDNLRDEGEILWIHCFSRLRSLTLKLVGRINNRKPRNEVLYPRGLIPKPTYTKDYSTIGVRDSIELQNIGKILRNIIAPLKLLDTVAISIPSICLVPCDRPGFNSQIDLYRHLDTVTHLKNLTLIVACLPGSELELPMNDLQWEQNLPEGLLKSRVNLTIKFYNSEVIYQRTFNN
ncbi:hypothetical protein TRICI_005420 [Trichomonascus ciferrii]|uniref:Uncharacterized protein n=1 Tax=Trichomonascus ciferrii TaxID=44093 RepID=A0A642UZB3_9ASCO|nr:hypothetical protein TRICI_005420 [Trichomonascus ciferrii]